MIREIDMMSENQRQSKVGNFFFLRGEVGLPFSSLLLRVPWTARRSNRSILKEINPKYSLEGLMLKLQHFDHLM